MIARLAQGSAPARLTTLRDSNEATFFPGFGKDREKPCKMRFVSRKNEMRKQEEL